MDRQKRSMSLNENIYMPKECEITDARMATSREKHLTLAFKDGTKISHIPGQFIEAGIPGFGEIPLGISSSPTRIANEFDLLVRQVGRVSGKIISLKKGDSLWVRGPLGNGVPVEEFENNHVLIAAGGIGLCPTRSMIQYIIDKYKDFKTFKLFFGCKSPDERLYTDDLEEWNKSPYVELYETVEKADGNWQGNVGMITDLFKKTKIDANSRVLVCGPPVMFKFIIDELDKIGVSHKDIFLDLERRMKCGIGKCGHCQFDDKYVCADGPVFRYSDIENSEEAFK